MSWLRHGTLLLAATLTLACESDDPEANNPVDGVSSGEICQPSPDSALQDRSDPSCMPLATDYRPRDNMSADDDYPACVSDAGDYVPSRAEGVDGISAIGRVAAFEEIKNILGFPGEKVPSPQDFLDARVVYSEEQGLESRINRREDEHYPPLDESCQDLSEAEQLANPERCVGPAQIRPIVLEAFQKGIDGDGDATVNAARIEAALIWFFYVSIHKEATSATIAKDDVDSVWAKYTGGEQRAGTAIGLASYIKPRSQQAHDRIFDGVLAVRCWRDVDDGDTASDLQLRDLARAQVDAALLHGLALIVRSRVQALDCSASHETLKILGHVLDREATERDPAAAQTLRVEVQKEDAADVNVETVVTALDTLFPCP